MNTTTPPPPEAAPAPPAKTHWAPPPAWELRVLCADGSVSAILHRCPHGAPHLIGDVESLEFIIDEVKSALRFFKPEPPFIHGQN